MAQSWMIRMLKKKSRPVSKSGHKQLDLGRFVPVLESLSDRILPAVLATFFSVDGLLRVEPR